MLAVAAASCGARSLDTGPQGAVDGAVPDGGIAMGDVVARDGVATIDVVAITADAVAGDDGGSCPIYKYERYEIACFGSDPGPYEKYLTPSVGLSQFE